MRRVVVAVPGDLDTPTGGYAYDKRIIAELRALGWTVELIDLGATFPFPDVAARTVADERLRGIADHSVVVIDGLAFGVLADEARALAQRCRIVALVHHPLALESGLSAAQAASLRKGETAALRHAHAIVVTSTPTKDILASEYDVAAARIMVVEPGVDRPVTARAKMPRDAVQLLAVGSLVPRKGYDVMVQALAELAAPPWQLAIAGDATRHPQTVAALRAQIDRCGLSASITLHGAVTAAQLSDLYAAADVFASASRFEGYGMVFSEAIAAGLPVVATDVGGARQVVGDAGVIVPVDDATALQSALQAVLSSQDLRQAMATRALERAARLPQWPQAGKAFATLLERLA